MQLYLKLYCIIYLGSASNYLVIIYALWVQSRMRRAVTSLPVSQANISMAVAQAGCLHRSSYIFLMSGSCYFVLCSYTHELMLTGAVKERSDRMSMMSIVKLMTIHLLLFLLHPLLWLLLPGTKRTLHLDQACFLLSMLRNSTDATLARRSRWQNQRGCKGNSVWY